MDKLDEKKVKLTEAAPTEQLAYDLAMNKTESSQEAADDNSLDLGVSIADLSAQSASAQRTKRRRRILLMLALIILSLSTSYYSFWLYNKTKLISVTELGLCADSVLDRQYGAKYEQDEALWLNLCARFTGTTSAGNNEALEIARAVAAKKNKDYFVARLCESRALEYIAQAKRSQNRYEVLEDYYKKALAINQEILGKTHPATLECLGRLFYEYFHHQKLEYAKQAADSGLKLCSESFGIRESTSAAFLECLRRIRPSYYKYKRVDVLSPETYSLFKDEVPATNAAPKLAISDSQMNAYRFILAGKIHEADCEYRKLLQQIASMKGIDSTKYRNAASCYATLLASQGRQEEAKRLCEKAHIELPTTTFTPLADSPITSPVCKPASYSGQRSRVATAFDVEEKLRPFAKQGTVAISELKTKANLTGFGFFVGPRMLLTSTSVIGSRSDILNRTAKSCSDESEFLLLRILAKDPEHGMTIVEALPSSPSSRLGRTLQISDLSTDAWTSGIYLFKNTDNTISFGSGIVTTVASNTTAPASTDVVKSCSLSNAEYLNLSASSGEKNDGAPCLGEDSKVMGVVVAKELAASARFIPPLIEKAEKVLAEQKNKSNEPEKGTQANKTPKAH